MGLTRNRVPRMNSLPRPPVRTIGVGIATDACRANAAGAPRGALSQSFGAH